MTFELDGRQMTTREAAHDHLAQQLAFPGWYGRNLDALYDLLTAGFPGEEIRLYHVGTMLQGLGDYGRRLLLTLQDAAENGGPRLIYDE